MADTRVIPLKVTRQGLTTSYTAGIIVATTDFVMKNDGATKIHFKKSGAGACTVTLKTPAKVGGLDVEEPTVTVPATTGDVMAGPFQCNLYNDAAGDMRFNFSEVTGLTFMPFV
jgi:hypothetical protein